MKIQNMSIIFLVVAIPLILILAYYISLQRDTLKMQAEYDLKLSEATKEGIRAYEVNINDYNSNIKGVDERRNVNAMVSAFLTSLANKLNISGTAKEYISLYVPAVTVTMYNGYYIYAPTYVPVNWEDNNGVQLYYDTVDKKVTDISGDNAEPLYIAASGGTSRTFNGSTEVVTTDINNARYQWKYLLSSKIAYTQNCTGTNYKLVMNYTLDNRVFFYGTYKNQYIERDGYLVYFSSDDDLPRITKTSDTSIDIIHPVYNTVYRKNNGSDRYETLIEPETLEEQVVYTDDLSTYRLGTFKYVYDITHTKLYYDESKTEFFKVDANCRRKYVGGKSDTSIRVGDTNCLYKSVSVLLGTGKTTEYKKIYQVLNGADQGKWYMNLKDDDPANLGSGITEELDIEIKNPELTTLGLNYNKDGIDYTPLYKDYSAISYYVEAYAFTNWVTNNNFYYSKTELSDGTVLPKEKIQVSYNNDPEDPNSDFVKRKRKVATDNINTNLNLAISSYGGNSVGQFELPVLTEDDWNQVFSNVSMITFFQDVPIGLKKFNNYAIATSTSNKEYVDPGEILLRANGDINYHRVYCERTENVQYTGYRSIEYLMKNYVKYDDDTHDILGDPIYYYQHDVYQTSDNNAERACYYCAINKSNYRKIVGDNDRIYSQAKSYNEALARERYYQKEALSANLTYQEKEIKIITMHEVPPSPSTTSAEVVVVLDYESTTMPWHNNRDYDQPTASHFYVEAIQAAADAAGISVKFVSTNTATLGVDYTTTSFRGEDCQYQASWALAISQFSNTGKTRVLLALSYKPDQYIKAGSFNYLKSHSNSYDLLFGTFCCHAGGTWADWDTIPHWSGQLGWSSESMTDRFKSLIEQIGETTPTYESNPPYTVTTQDLVIPLPNLDTTRDILVTIDGKTYRYCSNFYTGIRYDNAKKKYVMDFKDIVLELGITADKWNAANVTVTYSLK